MGSAPFVAANAVFLWGTLVVVADLLCRSRPASAPVAEHAAGNGGDVSGTFPGTFLGTFLGNTGTVDRRVTDR
jgi:hypothetical protein